MTSTAARRLVFALLFLAAAQVVALDVPPKPAQGVNDYGANLLTASETEQLNSHIEQLRTRTGAQMLVMIWPSLEGEDAISFTRSVAKMWKVNDDRALMLFVFVEDRKTFIQVGRGLKPVISDAFAADIYRNTLVPHFRQRQFYAGIDIAIDRVAAALEPAPAPAVVVPPAIQTVHTAPPPADRASDWTSADFFIVFFGLGMAVLGVILIIVMMRRGTGTGSGTAVNQWQMLDIPPPVDPPSPQFMAPPTDFSSPVATTVGSSDAGGSWGGGSSSFDGNGAGGSW